MPRLAVLAVCCPPLAVAAAGRPGQVPLNLALTAVLYLPGLLHALWVADRAATDRRNGALMRVDAMQYA